MKKSIIFLLGAGIIIIILALVILFFNNTNNKQVDSAANANVNNATLSNNDFLAQSFLNLGISLKYPKGASVSTRDYSQTSGAITINKPSEELVDYYETYELKKNVAVDKGMTLEDYVTKLNGVEYQNKVQSITLNSKEAFQVKSLKSTDIYIGTYFEDNNSNLYQFYIEQTAPSSQGEYTAYLTEDYLSQIENTYEKILNSIKIN